MIALLIAYPAFCIFLYAWMVLAVLIFFMLLYITAPYGRHASVKWGPVVSNRLGWVFMEFPVLIIFIVIILPFMHLVSTVSWIMIGLFFLHYINRSFVFPLRLHTKGKKMPLVIMGSGIVFNIISGFSLAYYFVHFAHYTNAWLIDMRFLGGVILFFAGMYINWKADDMLIHLRKPGETHYSIPKKWLFDLISCPNLFGELLEWLGFAVLCWNLPALGFFVWTAANLIPRALSHHRWYKNTFREYPAHRRAILPFLL